VAPPAEERALFQKDGRADAWAIVNGEPLYVEDETQGIIGQASAYHTRRADE
jgi:hypothetical protein